MTADVLDLLPQAAPGGWQAKHEPRAPGAVLDGQPWAKNWAAFLRALSARDGSAREFIANAAMGERVGSEGGFLVPEILRAQVLAYMTPAIVRPRAQVLPMSSLRLPVPLLDNPSQASGAQALGGLTFAFAEEGAAIAQSNPAFGRVVLEARKLAALCSAPNELVDDAAGAWGDFLARVIAMGLAWTEDDFFIGTNGTGIACPQAIVNAPAAVPVTRGGSNAVVFLDVVTMFKALHPASKQVGLTPGVTDVCWLLSSSAMDQLLELNYQVTVNATTTPIPPSGWFSMGDGHDIGPNMLGLPAIVTDHQPALGTTGDVMLADLRHYLIGDRQVMQIERAQEAQFISDNSYFRIRERVDGRYWVQSATTTEANQPVSPVVVLH